MQGFARELTQFIKDNIAIKVESQPDQPAILVLDVKNFNATNATSFVQFVTKNATISEDVAEEFSKNWTLQNVVQKKDPNKLKPPKIPTDQLANKNRPKRKAGFTDVERMEDDNNLVELDHIVIKSDSEQIEKDRMRKENDQEEADLKSHDKNISDYIRRVIILLEHVTMARDMFENVSPFCLQYILLVRAVPAYKSLQKPPEPCEEDFKLYDWLNRVEVFAFSKLSANDQEKLMPGYHERHNKWFHRGTPYEGPFAKNVMKRLSVLEPYKDKELFDLFAPEELQNNVAIKQSTKEIHAVENPKRADRKRKRRKRAITAKVRVMLSVVRVGLFTATIIGTGGTGTIAIAVIQAAICGYKAYHAYMDFLESKKLAKQHDGTAKLALEFNRSVQSKARELAEFLKENIEERRNLDDGSKSLTLVLRDFKAHNRSKYVQAVIEQITLARDLIEDINVECKQYIHIIRVMPAYKGVTNPLAHCEDDFVNFDMLIRYETIAHYTLPKEYKELLIADIYDRHVKLYKQDKNLYGPTARMIMKKMSYPHPYSDNPYWLSVGIGGQLSVDADSFEHLHAQPVYPLAKVSEHDDEQQRLVALRPHHSLPKNHTINKSEHDLRREITTRPKRKSNFYDAEWTRKKRAMGPGVQASIAAMSGLAVIIGYENFSHIANELNNLLKISLDLYQIWIFGNDHVEQQRKLSNPNGQDVLLKAPALVVSSFTEKKEGRKEEDNDKLKIVIKFDKTKQNLARDLAKFIRDNVELELLIDGDKEAVLLHMKKFDSDKSSSIIHEISDVQKSGANDNNSDDILIKKVNSERQIILLGLVAIARDWFEEISPLCLQYILLVRAMPAYRSTRDPPEPCKDDFDDYDWLNRVEAIAFKKLPDNFKKI
uniref:Uncharacterized protein n=1 Tax=Ditylenchus dipsaci TaxID=166011 RepID=A0A915EVR7_9BILA